MTDLAPEYRQAIEWYTATRWDVALPEGHPYKDVPFDERRFQEITKLARTESAEADK